MSEIPVYHKFWYIGNSNASKLDTSEIPVCWNSYTWEDIGNS